VATIIAQASGNFSATDTWAGGVVPGPGDVAQTGNFTVTVDQSITVAQLNPTGSGRFEVAVGGITINADLVTQSSYAGGGLRCAHPTGTVTVNGTATGGTAAYTCGVSNAAAGTLNVTTATGGTGSGAYGAINNSNGTLNVTTATGGTGVNAYGAINNSNGTLNVTTATGGTGSNAHGAINASNGTLICDLAIGNSGGPGGATGNITNGVYGSGTNGQVTCVRRSRSGPYGGAGIGGAVLIDPHATNSAEFRTAYGGATKTLVDSGAAADFPATADVRAGTVYDVGARAGTLAVPAANQVAVGVAVDATVGTAVLTAANVRGAVGLTAANLDEQLDAIPTNAELATALAGADDAVLAAIAALNNLSGVGAQAAAEAALAAYNAATESDVDGLSIPTAGQVAADIWTYGARTLTAATVAGPGAPIDGAALTLHRGDTFSVSMTGLGNITTRTKLWFTTKQRTHHPDNAAQIQVIEADGLTVIAGSAAGTPANGSLVVTDAATGSVTLTLDEVETAKLAPGVGLLWDVQMRTATTVTTLAIGTLEIVADVTWATS